MKHEVHIDVLGFVIVAILLGLGIGMFAGAVVWGYRLFAG